MSGTEELWKRWAEMDYLGQQSLSVIKAAIETKLAPEWLLKYVDAYGAARQAEGTLMREIATHAPPKLSSSRDCVPLME